MSTARPRTRVAIDLDLAGMHPSADAEAERPERADDRGGAANRARGAVEGGEGPPAGRLDLVTAEPGHLGKDNLGGVA